jgi:hypothetical protein
VTPRLKWTLILDRTAAAHLPLRSGPAGTRRRHHHRLALVSGSGLPLRLSDPLLATVVAFLSGGLLAAAVLAVNWLLLPARLADTRVLRPFRSRPGRIGTRTLRGILIGAGFLIAFIMAETLSGQWLDFLLFSRAVPFGLTDPIFGRDVSFYIFRLPVYDLLAGWFLALAILSLLGALVVYGTAGALGDRGPIAHLSVLGALTPGSHRRPVPTGPLPTAHLQPGRRLRRRLYRHPRPYPHLPPPHRRPAGCRSSLSDQRLPPPLALPPHHRWRLAAPDRRQFPLPLRRPALRRRPQRTGR